MTVVKLAGVAVLLLLVPRRSSSSHPVVNLRNTQPVSNQGRQSQIDGIKPPINRTEGR